MAMGSNTSKGARAAIALVLGLGSTLALLGGCGSIQTAPGLSSTAQLTPNPPVIIVKPFRISTAKWLVGQNQWYDREDWNFVKFKDDFQIKFQKALMVRLQKVAPIKAYWPGTLPQQGWMVGGDFLTVFQGSRALRAGVGFGAGETTFQTKVYVYDLSRSQTEYVLSFYTGVPDPQHGGGSGSGQTPGLIAGNAPGAAIATGEGLSWDMDRTAREIRDILMTYR